MQSQSQTLRTPISDIVLHEVLPAHSREKVTVAAGNVVSPGLVLACIALGVAISAPVAGNTGDGVLTLDAVAPILPHAAAGTYQVRCIGAAANGGTFRVHAPDGSVLGDVDVGATFANRIQFSIADGAADFVVGDGFDIAVPAGSGKYVAFDPAGHSGAEIAAAIGYEDIDATLADASGIVLARGGVVDTAGLVWPADITAEQQAAALAQLEARGIVTRAAL